LLQISAVTLEYNNNKLNESRTLFSIIAALVNDNSAYAVNKINEEAVYKGATLEINTNSVDNESAINHVAQEIEHEITFPRGYGKTGVQIEILRPASSINIGSTGVRFDESTTSDEPTHIEPTDEASSVSRAGDTKANDNVSHDTDDSTSNTSDNASTDNSNYVCALKNSYQS